MTNDASIDLPMVYAKLLWKSVRAEPGSLQVGNSIFDPVVAKLDDGVDASPERDAAVYGIVTAMTARRFLALAKPNPFDEPAFPGAYAIPTLHLFTDDERRGMSVAAVSGVREALAHRDANGTDAPLPVVVFVENNQKPVAGRDVDEVLLGKLRFGIFAKYGHGRYEAFVRGCSFEQVHVPTGTPDDYDAFELPPEAWAEAVRRHLDECFGPVPTDLVPVGQPGW